MAASTTARASGLSRSRYSVIPPPMSCPHDRTVRPRCRSSTSCNSRPRPYRASSAGRTRRTPAGPSTCPIATSPAATASTAAGSISGVSWASSDATTHPADTDSRPVGHRRPRPRQTTVPRQVPVSSRTALATSPASRAVQRRAPVGHPLRHRPRLRLRDLTTGDRLRGEREPARARGRRQRVDHRQHHIQVRHRSARGPAPAAPATPASRRTARRPAPRRRSAPRCPYPHARTHHRQPPNNQSRSSTT